MKFRGEFEKSGIDEIDEMCEAIRESMSRSNLSSSWLIAQLEAQGIRVDNTALSMILHGKRCGKKPVKVIRVAYAIIQSYEEWAEEAATRDFDEEAAPLF